MEALNQAKNLIEKSQNVFIAPSPDLGGDSLGSALALFFTLKKLGKNANLLIEKIPEKFQFLFDPRLLSSKDFVISINTLGKEVSAIRYEKNDRDLKICLALSKGRLDATDIKLKEEDFCNKNPNLLITLGTKSLENLGEVFNQNSRLFFEAPILNIDNQPSNENFGEVNLIEITSSLAEISTNLIKLMDPAETLIDKALASCLLCGIIWSSQNFRNPKTRPKTLETAAFLIKKGADHQNIIQHLYKQKSISQIKLLGRILEKLNFDEKKEVYSAALTKRDFEDCGASSKDLGFSLEELKFNFRYLPNLLILWESHASLTLVKGIFYSPKSDLTEKILENFEGISRGGGALFLIREGDLNSAKEKVLKIL